MSMMAREMKLVSPVPHFNKFNPMLYFPLKQSHLYVVIRMYLMMRMLYLMRMYLMRMYLMRMYLIRMYLMRMYLIRMYLMRMLYLM